MYLENETESLFKQEISQKGMYNFFIRDVGDEYHKLSELYNHRYALFCALVKIYDNYVTPLGSSVKCWKSKLHDDGTMFDDSFIAGITIRHFPFNADDKAPFQYITYHLSLSWWDKFKVIEYTSAPKYDGHNSDDVIERLLKL